jgi:DNA polymerase III delta subunit
MKGILPYSGWKKDKVLEKGAPHRVYGTLGDADLQKRVVGTLLEWTLPPDARDFNLDTIDGEGHGVTDVLALAGNVPFLSDFRVVHVTRAERLDNMHRAGDGEAKPDKKKGKLSPTKMFAEGIAALPPSTILVLSRTPETPEPGARAGAVRCVHATVDKVIEKEGLVVNCTIGPKDSGLATAIIENEAPERGLVLERGVAAHLVARVGTDLALAWNELEKCALRVGEGGPVTREVVNEMTRRAPQETIFDLTDALGDRQNAKALTLMRELMGSGEAPELLLSMLVRHFSLLLQARALVDARVPLDASAAQKVPPALAAQMPKEGLLNTLRAQAWMGRRLAQQARNFSPERLESALALCFEADLALKQIEGDGGAESDKHSELVLELLLAQLA